MLDQVISLEIFISFASLKLCFHNSLYSLYIEVSLQNIKYFLLIISIRFYTEKRVLKIGGKMLQFRRINLLIFGAEVKTSHYQITFRNFFLFCRECFVANLVELKGMEESGESQIKLKLNQAELIKHFLQSLRLFILFLFYHHILFLTHVLSEGGSSAFLLFTLLLLVFDMFFRFILLSLLIFESNQCSGLWHANVNIIQPGFDGIVKLPQLAILTI